MNAQKLIKPAKLKMDGKGKTTLPNDGEKDLNVVVEHDYAMDVTRLKKRERGAESAPTTPNKKPTEKKSKSADNGEDTDVSRSAQAILDAILNLERRFDGFEKKVDLQLADLKEQTKQSSAAIVSLSKAVQFNAEEVKECQKKVQDLVKQNDKLCKENTELKDRIREQERYRMRWCLQLKGLREEKGESVRTLVLQILRKIFPDGEAKLEEAVDIVHRVGRKMDGKHRRVVILFAKRQMKDEIWRRSKDSPVCKENGIRFAEMLPREDWEERRRLWPQIEQALNLHPCSTLANCVLLPKRAAG